MMNDPRNLVVMRIDTRAMTAILKALDVERKLPSDCRVINAFYEAWTDKYGLVLQSVEFPTAPEGKTLPELTVSIKTETFGKFDDVQITDEFGKGSL